MVDLFEELAPVAVPAPVTVAPATTVAPLCTKKPGYLLPAAVEADVWLIPISGGADSSALAILLHEMFPEVPWRLVFTDTGTEEPEIYESLK